ncbi:hypothetical protein DERP_007848 [Dermatophagoides pteronyssinus]|uniref:Uncharacterized protein n=1 Tax=Dermatophagoides pteronyssinus TaxID=6956 RepID=A0ABQ8IT15_DERPT|nr:hypothetical protein DERP_007848 [Dermatophagoides pteronyssinus]
MAIMENQIEKTITLNVKTSSSIKGVKNVPESSKILENFLKFQIEINDDDLGGNQNRFCACFKSPL